MESQWLFHTLFTFELIGRAHISFEILLLSIVLFTHNLKHKYLFIQEHCLSNVWWSVRMWLVISAMPHMLCRWLHKGVESWISCHLIKNRLIKLESLGVLLFLEMSFVFHYPYCMNSLRQGFAFITGTNYKRSNGLKIDLIRIKLIN